MASSRSKAAKKRKARQRAKQHRSARSRERAHDEEHHHLPKVGTPDNDEYRLERSREDLVGFGEFRRSAGPWPTILAIGVGLLFALGVAVFVLFD